VTINVNISARNSSILNDRVITCITTVSQTPVLSDDRLATEIAAAVLLYFNHRRRNLSGHEGRGSPVTCPMETCFWLHIIRRNLVSQRKRFRLLLHISPWRGLSVCLSVCRLSHSCTLLKPFDGFRCRLAGTLLGSNDRLC